MSQWVDERVKPGYKELSRATYGYRFARIAPARFVLAGFFIPTSPNAGWMTRLTMTDPKSQRIRRASTGPTELHYIGMAAIMAHPEWWSLSLKQALAIAAKATQARFNPKHTASEFTRMVEEVGLEVAKPVREDDE